VPSQGEPGGTGGTPQPGLILICAMGQPRCVPLPLEPASRSGGSQLELGRGDGLGAMPADRRMSRRHARVAYEGGRFRVTDLGSQNGTFLDGAAVEPEAVSPSARVLRTGDSIFLLAADLRPFQACGVKTQDGRVVGPNLQRALTQIARAARFSSTLHITGESGVGKEGAATAFHAGGPHSTGAFVAVNCATIPEGVAERLLFGAKRGAFSGAVADVEGYVQAADGGTLFLDEIAELDLSVQAKLLRVLETREVAQLGATRSRSVKLQLCSASNKELRVEVGAGRFREDLYFRLSRPEVELPPLRHRLEEIPWLIDQELRLVSAESRAHASLVEACLLRFWPGNVRELLTEVRAAGHEALGGVGEGEPESCGTVEARHLATTAGMAFVAEPPADHPAICAAGVTPSRELIEKALKRTGGNVSGTSRLLGLHRTQLRRLLDRLGIDPARFAPGAPDQTE